MNAVTLPALASTGRIAPAVLVGGGLAATLDLMFATAFYTPPGVSYLMVPKSIASGLLGGSAFQGGLPTALLGAALHYGILFVAALLFSLAAQRLSRLRAQPYTYGLLFGIAVYGVMNFVVLPLSAIPFNPDRSLRATVIGLVVHMLLVGLPIALAARRFLGAPRLAR